MISQVGPEGEQYPGGAEAALQAVLGVEGLLQRAWRLRRGESFHRGQGAAAGLDGEHETGADRLAVEQHRAGAAYAVLAAHVRARQAAAVPQRVREQGTRLHVELVRLAVHGELRDHAATASARRTASTRTRRVRCRTSRRR